MRRDRRTAAGASMPGVRDTPTWPAPWRDAAAHAEALRALQSGAGGGVARSLRLAVRATGATLVVVSLATDDGVASWCSDGSELASEASGSGFADHAARRSEPLVVEDATADERFADHPWVVGEPAVRSYAGVPVTLDDGAVVGTVAVVDRVAGAASDEATLGVLRDVAASLADQVERVGSALALREARADLRRAEASDALTGLANRRTLHERLDGALALARRTGHGVALAVVDLSGFAGVNERHGVWVGDAVLLQVASALEGAARDHDLVARVGDDAFACVWQAVSENGAMVAAQRVERHVARTYNVVDPVAPGSLEVELGASVGVAIFPHDAEDAAGLLRAADVALDRAKRVGGGIMRFDPRS
jgi:diguanylate cyclase (GGDEF)-like protein